MLNSMPDIEEITEEITEELTLVPAKVILFNDDYHYIGDVVGQIILAIKCTTDIAWAIALKAHYTGKALVFAGDIEECLRVDAILTKIGLYTQIEM